MPRPFNPLSRQDFARIVDQFDWRSASRKNAIHMHHTWRPDHSQYDGLRTIEGMWRFHTQTRGWSDIAQHVSIAPDGTIWTGRDWNRSPASAVGHNSRKVFMFETIGDFDTGKDELEGEQMESVLFVSATIQERFKSFGEVALIFHNEFSDKSCPGTAINQADFLERLSEYRYSISEALAESALASADEDEVKRIQEISKSIQDPREDLQDDNDGEHTHDEAFATEIERYLKPQ